MPRPFTRRTLLKSSAALGAGMMVGPSLRPFGTAASDRLDVAVVGVASRGRANLDGVAAENVVALCDVDRVQLDAAAERFPRARTFQDWRKMLDAVKADAVVVSTPDHHHAPVTLAAMQLGWHAYTEKPLAHTVEEARRMAELAAEKGLVTQMGTQIHAGGNYRRVVEAIRSGVLGRVPEVHVFCNAHWGGGGRPTGQHATPGHLDWDVWLGPAPSRPYAPGYHPAQWRRYWDFGGGSLADMACHFVDLPFWALGLRHPISVEAEGEDEHHGSCPRWSSVRWEFPQRGARGPVLLTWHDGGRYPDARREWGCEDWDSGVLFVGEKGALIADYSRFQLLPAEEFSGWQAPPRSIPDSVGHHREWIEACKGRGKTTCHFDHAGALTETVLLGTVAYRCRTRLSWDPDSLTATGHADAHGLVKKVYRSGWQI